MTTTVEPILTTRNLVKRYGRVTALDQCDFDLYPNEILAVIGDNGAPIDSQHPIWTGGLGKGTCCGDDHLPFWQVGQKCRATVGVEFR